MSVSESDIKSNSNSENFSLHSMNVSSKNNYCNCCLSLLKKCKKYKKIIKYYKRQQEYVNICRFIILLMTFWLLYRTYHMMVNNKPFIEV